jgi:hypothetical protein
VFTSLSLHSSPAVPRRLLVLLGGAFAVVLAVAGLSAGSAQAATGACPGSTLSQPFLQWGDSNWYTLVPEGNFEGSLASWTLSGGAHKAPGSESYDVTGSVGASSLALAPGATAQSPFVCITPEYPSFRFFARSEGSSSTLLAAVVYKTPLGNVTVPVGLVGDGAAWQPTKILPTGAVLASALSHGTAQLALRFTAFAGGSRIDDVFVDPRMR